MSTDTSARLTFAFPRDAVNTASLHLCNAKAILNLATDGNRDVDDDVTTAMFVALEYLSRAKEIIDSPAREDAT